MARRNPYGYIIAGRTRPHAYSATRDFPYEDRVEAKRAIGERVRGMGRRGDDVSFDAYLTEPRGRKIRKTRIRVPGFTVSRGLSRNPDVRLTWTQRGHTTYDPTGHGERYGGGAWWRTGLKKPKEVKRAVRAAHKYALKQKDWLSHRVTVENPRMKASEAFIRTLDAGLSDIIALKGNIRPSIRTRWKEKVLDHFKAHPSQLYFLVHDAVTPGHKHNARFDMPENIAFHSEGNTLTDAQIETAVKHVIKKRASHSSNPKLRPFPTTACKASYYTVLGRRYEDFSTARAMAEKFSQESGRAVPIMKKDDAYSPAYLLQKVERVSNPRRKRSYKRRNPGVRRKRHAPKRGYRKLSRAAKRRPRNAKGQFIKRKRSKRR